MMHIILTIVIWLLSVCGANAQTGLKVNELFEGRIIPQERMMETRVRGKTLEKYHLTFYRSLRFNANEEELIRLRQLVESDGRGRFVSVYKVQSAYTQKIQVPGQNGKNSFLCYQEQSTAQKGQREVTVIYLEGNVASLGELEELLK